jgi:hypothetical protein
MDETESLRAELEHYRTEREKIRNIVGQIGGKTGRRVNMVINAVFLFLVLCAFGFDLLRHAMGWEIPYLPSTLLLEVAVLLVSLKIVWMIHAQTKVDHFQFWILNSIEFRMNMVSRRITELDETIRARMAEPGGKSQGDRPPPGPA